MPLKLFWFRLFTFRQHFLLWKYTFLPLMQRQQQRNTLFMALCSLSLSLSLSLSVFFTVVYSLFTESVPHCGPENSSWYLKKFIHLYINIFNVYYKYVNMCMCICMSPQLFVYVSTYFLHSPGIFLKILLLVILFFFYYRNVCVFFVQQWHGFVLFSCC